jgi:hypothetical protein
MTEEPGNARGPHVTPDVLADLQAGLLHDRAERAAREHLVACPGCQADLEVLAAIPGRLAAAGSVEPIPADVASRLDAALAAAASAPPDMAATPTIVPSLATTATHRRDRSSPRGLRLLQAAAVLVVVLGLGALAVSAIHGGRDGSGGASTAGAADSARGAKSAPQAAFPVTASGRDWTAGSLTAAVPRLVAGSLSPVITRGPLDDSTLKSAAGSGSSTPAPSGSVSAAAVPEYAVSGNAAGRLAGGTALAACVAGLVGGPATPLAVDLATYQGKPAAVILLPGLAGPDRIDVWVVPADCSSTTATFLYYGSVPRP